MGKHSTFPTTDSPKTWLRHAFTRLVARDSFGATLRLVCVAGTAAIYWLVLGFTIQIPQRAPIEWLTGLPFPADVLLEYGLSLFTPQVLVHVLPVLLGLVIGIQVATHYLADLVEFPSSSKASRYLHASLFGFGYYNLDVVDNEHNHLDSMHPLVRIGGPGYLTIHLGFAAVTETIDGHPRVYGSIKRRFIDGFERPRDLVDLRDQLGKVDEVRAVTRDGIEIYARDAQMMFRVFGGGRKRNLQTPYPFDETAVRKLVYGRAISSTGPRNWSDMLADLVRDEIRSFVTGLTIDEFLALQPRVLLEGTPASKPKLRSQTIHISRRRLTERFHTPEARQRLQDRGLELDWVGVGTWEIRDPPSLAPLEVGPGETIVSTWRDLQRARLYQKPDYLQRQRDFAYQSYSGRVFRELVGIWESEEGDYPSRCWLLLAAGFLRHLQDMHRSLASSPQGQIPLDFQAAVDHVRALVKPENL